MATIWPYEIYSQIQWDFPDFVHQKEIGELPKKYKKSEVRGGDGHISLEFDYAQPFILNPLDYQLAKGSSVTAIDLVYTKYPEDFAEWRTDHDWLLQQRLNSLHKLDSLIFTQSKVRWRLILQTDCQTEPEAQQFFHGLILHVEALPDTSIYALGDSVPEMKPLIQQIYFGPLQDSSIYYVLDRHPQWTDKLVVMDWTASMYKNGAATMNWHRKQLEGQAIKHLVLFNDGNRTPHALKKIGKTGGVYHIQPDTLTDVFELMVKVMRAGLGGDPAENDIEALVRSTHTLEDDYGELVLIPDRNSSIRDIRLLKYLNKPVRIVLFKNAKTRSVGLGSTGELVENHYIHPHYLTLASITKGSIHTIGRDIYELSDMKKGEVIRFWEMELSKAGRWQLSSHSLIDDRIDKLN